MNKYTVYRSAEAHPVRVVGKKRADGLPPRLRAQRRITLCIKLSPVVYENEAG